MADTLSTEERSRLMSRIRGKDTKPELVIRRLLHAMGYRFRLHRRDLLREGKSENADVDYVVAPDGKILPIEVKAGAAGSLKSLHQFCHEKNYAMALRFDLNKSNRFQVTFKTREAATTAEVHFELLSLPLYCGGIC